MTPSLALHPGLAKTSRLFHWTRSSDHATARDWMILMGVGVVAACCSTLIDLHMRVPGHSILKVVFPVAAGLALVPRKGAGSIIGISAILTAMSLRSAGFGGSGLGTGALTSMTVIGPALDLMLRNVQSSRGIYVSLICGGLLANITALLVRGSFKWLGIEKAGARPLWAWLSHASVTYVICGIVAGLLSAAVWFYVRPPAESSTEQVSESAL